MAERRGAGPVLAIGLLVALGAAAYLLLTRGAAEETGVIDGAARESSPGAGTGPTLEGRGPAAAPVRATPSAGPAALPAPPPETADSVVLIGRVVDERRRPVAGAAVTARLEGYPEAGLHTGADGRFRLPIGPPGDRISQGCVQVVGGGGLAALAYAWTGDRSQPREVNLGVITLRKAGSLRVRVEHAGGPVAEAQVSVRITSGVMPMRVALLKCDARGEVRLLGLPPGSYRVAAVAPGHGRAVGVVQVNAAVASAELLLALGEPRTVDVLVLDKQTEAPVAGATLTLEELIQGQMGLTSVPFDPPLEVASTDAAGKTRLEGLGTEDKPRLSATAPGYSGGNPRDFGQGGRPVMLAAEATEARLLLEAPVALRWPIKSGDPLAPPDGTRLPLEPDPGAVGATLPKEVRVEGGFLVAEGFSTGPIHAFAVATDGVYARLFRLPSEADGREVAFQRERRIDVLVRRADGTPATGLFVTARNQGNNALGEGTPLDAEGRAVLLLKHPHLVEVYVSRSRDAWSGSVLGSADLRTGDAKVEGTLPAERDLLLSVRLSGKPGLPGSFAVGAYGMPQAGEALEEDPEAGTLLLRLALPAPLPGGKAPTVWIRAAGFVQATAEVSGFEGDGPLRASVDLEPAGALRVRVMTPADKRPDRPLLQRFDAARNAWSPAPGWGPGAGQRSDEGPQGYSLLHEGLTPGRYRLVTLDCGEASAPVEVRGGAESEALLDLSRSGPVTGTVEVPEGFDVGRTTLTVEVGDLGSTFGQPPGQGQVRKDGTFSVRVPGSRPVALRVRHPLLKPDAASAALLLDRPQEGLRLRLVTGPTARFTLPGVMAASSPFPGMGGLRVLLFDGAPGAKPLLTCAPELAGPTWSFGGYEPGTYTVWIDTGSTAPLEQRGVVLGEGETDLGALATGPGTTVRVRVKAKEGTAVPRLSVWVQHLGEPAYQRGTNSRGGPDDVLVSGLGAGRFRVTGGAVMGAMGGGGAPGRGLDETFEADGASEVVLDLDLR